jgi:hypothetical protein
MQLSADFLKARIAGFGSLYKKRQSVVEHAAVKRVLPNLNAMPDATRPAAGRRSICLWKLYLMTAILSFLPPL